MEESKLRILNPNQSLEGVIIVFYDDNNTYENKAKKGEICQKIAKLNGVSLNYH